MEEGKSLFKGPGEREFWKGILIFCFLPGRKSDFNNLRHFWAFQTYKIKKTNILPAPSHHSFMFSNPTKIYQKVWLWGKSLWKMPLEKSFWGGIEDF